MLRMLKKRHGLLFLMALSIGSVASPAHAAEYYWDNNGATAGFGTAGGTWGTSEFWNTSSTGNPAPTFTAPTTTTDDLHFGTGTDGLAGGTVAVGTGQGFGSMTFGSASGAINIGASGTSLAMDSAATITVNTPSLINLYSELTGNADFTKLGVGRVQLANTSNSFIGTIFMDAGILNFNNGDGVLGNAANDITFTGNSTLQRSVAGTTTLNAGRTIAINPGVTATFEAASGIIEVAGDITGGATASLTKIGGGTLILSGANTYAGTTTISAGTLVIGGAGTLGAGTYAGNIANSGTLSFSTSSDQTLSGVISGAGTLSKSGAGTLTLSNVNTYTGATIVSGGVLNLTAGNIGSATNNAQGRVGNANGNVAALRQSGGMFTQGGATTQFIVGFSGSYGVYELSNGSFSITTDTAGAFRLGIRNGQFTQTGGAFNVTYEGSGAISTSTQFQIGGVALDQGRVYATGGTATIATGNRTGTVLQIGSATSGVNGEVTIAGTADWQLTGTAGGVLLSGGSGASGTLNLNGTGKLTAVQVLDGGGTGRLNFDGGTLKAGPGAVTDFLTGLDSARIYSGGAIIDDGGNTITIGQALTAPTGNVLATIPVLTGGSGYIGAPLVTITGGGGTGATAVADYDPATGVVTGIIITSPGSGYTSAPTVELSGGFQTGGTAATLDTATLTTAPTTGGFTKLGSGITTLSAVNTYTGPTTVNVGTLAVTGSIIGNGPESVFVAAPDSIKDASDPAIVRRVANGTSYTLGSSTGLGSTAVGTDPVTASSLNTTAAILAGTASSQSDVSMQWRTRTTSEADASNTNAVLSDVVNLTGVAPVGGFTDVFLLEMSYNDAALAALGLNETAIATSGELRLGWLNGSTWTTAVDGNSGASVSTFVGIVSATDFLSGMTGTLADNLGSYGVDPANNKVWAVLDHNSEFAVIPEPSTLVAGGLAMLGFAGAGLRRRRQQA